MAREFDEASQASHTAEQPKRPEMDSFDSLLDDVESRIGEKGDFSALAEAAEFKQSVENFRPLTEEYPEFKAWAKRKIGELRDLKTRLHTSEDIQKDLDVWRKGVVTAQEYWLGNRAEHEEDLARQERILKYVRIAREEMAQLESYDGRGRVAGALNRLEDSALEYPDMVHARFDLGPELEARIKARSWEDVKW